MKYRDHAEEIAAMVAGREKRRVCFKCGLIQCETCDPDHQVVSCTKCHKTPPPQSCFLSHPELIRAHDCPDCDSGWRQAKRQTIHALRSDGGHRNMSIPTTGTDPNVLCPKCKKEENDG